MTIVDFDGKCKQFFESFLLFYSGWNKGQSRKVELKKQHCYRVSELAGHIAVSLQLDKEEVALARIIGLLHDLGRFPQLLKFNTYDDSISADHASLAIDELERGNLLQDVDRETASLIKVAIYQHNKSVLPENLNEREMLFCNILRDADKLDILHSLTEYYANPFGEPSHTMSWDLPRGKGISEEVALAVKSGKSVTRDELKTQDDIKVMQLSWVYDLNFKASFRILSRGRYVDIIYSALPKRDIVFDIYRNVRIYVENQFLN
ncbi:HD superfamily phosphodieaserase, includes HD domain of RNase Y [Bacteroidales bacterium 6E]|nr:HD superfamily phosphodieaserase, includes HD domain of RNase Y [Bacteroidales bacterium 6E]